MSRLFSGAGHAASRFASAFRRMLPLVLLAALPCTAPAQQSDDTSTEPVELEEITVQANPLGRTSDQLVQPVDVISGDELVSKRRPTIGATLETEPGVSTSDFGAGAGRPVIRGQAGSRVQVLENGISSMDVSDVSPDHAVTISPAQATQIEIIKGPATLLYGSGTSGGVVNILNTRLPTDVTDGLHGTFESYYGSNGNDRAGTLDANYGVGSSMFHLDYGASKAKDYDIPGNASIDGSGSEGFLANSATEADSGALGYGYIGDAGSLGVAVSRLTTIYGLPNEEAAFIDMKQTRYDLYGVINRPLPGLESLKLRGAYNDYTHTEFEDPVTPGTVFYNKQHSERVEAVHAPLAGWRGVFGLQFGDRRFEAVGEEAFVPSTDTQDVGLFVVEEYPYSLGKIELGARVERDTNSPEGGSDRDFTLASFSAGSVFDLGSEYHLKVYATRAQRAPVPEELFSFGPHVATGTFERGLFDASKETADNFEIGLDHHSGRFTWQANVYYERFTDYLFLKENDEGLNADGSGVAASDGEADRVDEEGNFDPAGEFLLVNYQQADAKFWGFEAQVGYAILQGPFKLTATAFSDLVRGELDSGENLPRITPARYGIGLEGGQGPVTGAIDFIQVAKQDRIAPLETPTDDYSLLSADLAYHFRLGNRALADSQIYLRGSNLLDEEARRATSFIKDVAPLPGASVILGLRVAI